MMLALEPGVERAATRCHGILTHSPLPRSLHSTSEAPFLLRLPRPQLSLHMFIHA